MAVNMSDFQSSEFQKPLENLENWDNIFGVDCLNKPNCHNEGFFERSDGAEGTIEYECKRCHDTPNSKFNKRRGNK